MNSKQHRGRDKEDLRCALINELTDVLFAAGETIGVVMSSGLVELFRIWGDEIRRIRESSHSKISDEQLIDKLVDNFVNFSSVNPRS